MPAQNRRFQACLNQMKKPSEYPKQDQKIKTEFAQYISPGLKSMLSKQLISLKASVLGPNFPHLLLQHWLKQLAGSRDHQQLSVLRDLGCKEYLYYSKQRALIWIHTVLLWPLGCMAQLEPVVLLK